MDDITASSPLSNGDFSSLSDPLKGFAVEAFFTAASDNETEQIRSKRLDDFEVGLRSHALFLVEELMAQGDKSHEFTSALETLLSYLKDVTLFTVEMVQCAPQNDEDTGCKSPKSYGIAANPIFHRLPHTLLSDVTSTLPISTVQKLWSAIPTLSPFHPAGWSYYLCHPSIFVGGTKMLLLRICNSLLKQCSNRDVDAEFAGSIMTTLSHVFPLSERSAMNVLGSFNVENDTRWEGRDEFETGLAVRKTGENDNEQMDIDGKEGAVRTATASLGYEFYSTFWGVQKVFTDPPGTILAAKDGFDSFEKFIKDIKTILTVFESTPAIASSTIKTASEKVNHYKYLTSSQLLHLQLKDPEIRTHFLTQTIILLSHLNSSSVTFPTPSISSTPGSNPSKLNAQLKQTLQNQLSDLEIRAQQLLRSMKPGGEVYLRAICWILKERESMWRNWKKHKCAPPLEKVDENTKVLQTDIRKVLSGKKRKAADVITESNAIDLNHDLPGMLTLLKSSLSTLKSFLEPYVEACDPEAEVDAEYHPANDSVYCWRALRLMARNQNGDGQLRRFGNLRRQDGNFEGIIRDMWKADHDEDIPGTYIDIGDEEFQFRPKREEKNVDADMEDIASVGTPEVDASAKKVRMSEFEKAAMEVEEEILNDHEEETLAGHENHKGGNVTSDKNGNESKDAPAVASSGDGEIASSDKADDCKTGVKKEVQNGNAEVDDKPEENHPEDVSEEGKGKGINSVKSSTDTKGEGTQQSHANKPDTPSSKTANNEDTIAPKATIDQTSKTQKDFTDDERIPSTRSGNQVATKGSNGRNDEKPTAHSVKSTAKFTPRENIRQRQQQKSTDQPDKLTKQQKDDPKDISHSDEGPNKDRGSNRDSGSRQDRRDSRTGPPQQHQQRNRFGNRDERHVEGVGSDRDRRSDGHHNAAPQGRGRGTWQPPQGRGRGGRESGRGPRDERRGGRGRR